MMYPLPQYTQDTGYRVCVCIQNTIAVNPTTYHVGATCYR